METCRKILRETIYIAANLNRYTVHKGNITHISSTHLQTKFFVLIQDDPNRKSNISQNRHLFLVSTICCLVVQFQEERIIIKTLNCSVGYFPTFNSC
jgi:hypothetical protein